MSDENLEVEEIELTEEEKLKLAEEEKKKEEERLAKEKKEKEDKIQVLIDSVDFEEEETHKQYDRETQTEIEYKVKLVHKFFHNLGFCDHIKYKEEIEDLEGKIIEVEKEKEVFWNKKLILKHLKENLDVDKAQSLVDQIAGYKHNKKKGELELKLRDLTQNNCNFLKAFGEEFEIIKGEKKGVHHSDRIAKWDKDDLIFFEEKVKKLEEAKVKLDEKYKKEKPLKDRKRAYKEIDDLLFEALVEKLEEGRPEKMDKYLELRKDIKHRHPIEED
tara:strand:+ start:1384 stop:2205 length:822 start_codon:yes stop_codon:yes gene_type:complete